jgi:hypothetical protein
MLSTFSLCLTYGQIKYKGTFAGLEEIKGREDSLGEIHPYVDPLNPKRKWYHLSYLTFQGDSVFLKQIPVAIYKNDTIFSASDGGFYNYAGTIGLYEKKVLVSLTIVNCDYCPDRFKTFRPPKIIKDEIIDGDSTKIPGEIVTDTKQFKTMILKKIDANTILVNKNIYRRRKQPN